MRSVYVVLMISVALVGLSGCNRDNDDADDRCSCNCSHDRGSIIGRSDCVPAPAPMAVAIIRSNVDPVKSAPAPQPEVARIEKSVSAPIAAKPVQSVQPVAPAKIEEAAKIPPVAQLSPKRAFQTEQPNAVPVSIDSHYVRSERRHVNAITAEDPSAWSLTDF